MYFETTLTAERTEAAQQSGAWPGRMLNDYVLTTARQDPTRPAVTDARVTLTYGDLAVQSTDAALGLLALGVRPGDVVLVQLPNCSQFVVAALALERIAAVIMPVAPIFRQHEIANITSVVKPVGVITPSTYRNHSHTPMFDALFPGRDELRARVVVGDDSDGNWLGWEALLARGRACNDRAALMYLGHDPNAVCELMFTSGTTGVPKGVMHTANTLAAASAAAIRGLGISADDVCHMASTLGHQTGYGYGLWLPLQAGARVVLQERWSGTEFIDLVERHRISFAMGATPFLVDFLRALGDRTERASSLRIFVASGAPLPRPIAEEVRAKLSLRLAAGFGMTENGLVCVVRPDHSEEKIVTSDGLPLFGMEASIRNADMHALPPTQEGDLWLRGSFMFVGYVQGRAVTERSFDRDGWFNTGDRAYADDEGFIRITGRTKDIIVRGGENIPVKEIEDLVLLHPAVREVAIVAIPHPRLGEQACACVVVEENMSLHLEDLVSHLRGRRVTPQFWPERLVVKDALPKTVSGKVQKNRLREELMLTN